MDCGYFGGIAGINYEEIINCNTVMNLDIEGDHKEEDYYSSVGYLYVGGIAADNRGDVSNCYAISDIVAKAVCYVGRYNRGAAKAYIGGIVGENQGSINGVYASTKIDSRATGIVKNADGGYGDLLSRDFYNYIGNIVGRNESETISIDKTYYDENNSFVATGLTPTDVTNGPKNDIGSLTTKETFCAEDFIFDYLGWSKDSWELTYEGEYPILINQ